MNQALTSHSYFRLKTAHKSVICIFYFFQCQNFIFWQRDGRNTSLVLGMDYCYNIYVKKLIKEGTCHVDFCMWKNALISLITKI